MTISGSNITSLILVYFHLESSLSGDENTHGFFHCKISDWLWVLSLIFWSPDNIDGSKWNNVSHMIFVQVRILNMNSSGHIYFYHISANDIMSINYSIMVSSWKFYFLLHLKHIILFSIFICSYYFVKFTIHNKSISNIHNYFTSLMLRLIWFVIEWIQ